MTDLPRYRESPLRRPRTARLFNNIPHEARQNQWPHNQEAIRARFDGEGEPYGREEFDDFLSNYGVSAYTFTAYGVLITRTQGHIRSPGSPPRR